MKIHFRVNYHTEHEITMGHKLGFTPIPWVDVISATANMKGVDADRKLTSWGCG